MEGMDKAGIVLWVLGQLGTPAGGVCQGCPTVRFGAPGGVGWGEETGEEVFLGHRGFLQRRGCAGGSLVLGVHPHPSFPCWGETGWDWDSG